MFRKLFLYLIGIIIFFFKAFTISYAQKTSYQVVVYPQSLQNQFFESSTDSILILKTFQEKITNWREEGYLLANIDSISFQKDTCFVKLFKGEQFKWLKLSNGNVPDILLNRINFREKLYSSKPFSLKNWESLQQKILKDSEEHGFPFASISLDSVEIQGDKIKAQLKYEKGTLYVFDSLDYPENVRLKKKFLANYLGLIPQRPYNQSKIRMAENKLRSLPYLYLKSSPKVEFDDGKVYTKLELIPKKANQLEGVLGVLPNANRNGRLMLTGQFLLDLHNLFASGKRLKFQWQQFKPSSQTLNALYQHPNFLRTNIDLAGEFDLLKEENSFLNVQSQLSAFYPTAFWGTWKAILNSRSGRLIGNEQNTNSEATRTKFLAYGLGYEFQKLDDQIFPHKGWKFLIQSIAGNKQLTPSVADTTLMNLPKKTFQWQSQLELAKYWWLSSHSSLMLRTKAMKIWNDYLFINELQRFGGLQSMRGFNEREFFVSAFWFNTLEYRFHFDRKEGDESMFFLLLDQSWIEQDLYKGKTNNELWGVGAGLQLQTKAGIFNFVYALGKSEQQSFAPNLAKIHFGLLSRF
ncbi:MAG: membrane protein [Flammeovirgaceae bacterium]